MSAAEHASFYDGFWDAHTESPGPDEMIRLEEIECAFAEVILSSDLDILDLGCGRGWMAPTLHRWGRVTGVDYSVAGVSFARSHYGDAGEFVLAAPTDPHLGLGRNRRFDVVVCSEVIEHVVDAAGFLTQIHDLLRPGGWCVLTTPNGNLWEEYRSIPEFRRTFQPVENWLTPRAAKSLFHAAGFRVRRQRAFRDPDYRSTRAWPWRSILAVNLLRRIAPAPVMMQVNLLTELYQVIVGQRT